MNRALFVVFAAVVLLEPSAISQTCTPPANGAVVCSPTNGATVVSSATFTAAANSSAGMGDIWTYVDDVVVNKTTGTQATVSLNLSAGAHAVRIQAWDYSGTLFKAGVTINVSGTTVGGGTCAPP